MKTNKSFTKRLKITKNGKILGRAPGINHFQAKKSRGAQLKKKRMLTFRLSTKQVGQYAQGTTN